MKLKYKVEISTNLWIPQSSHIYSHRSRPWCTSILMAPEGPPFYTSMKRGESENKNERDVVGHF